MNAFNEDFMLCPTDFVFKPTSLINTLKIITVPTLIVDRFKGSHCGMFYGVSALLITIEFEASRCQSSLKLSKVIRLLTPRSFCSPDHQECINSFLLPLPIHVSSLSSINSALTTMIVNGSVFNLTKNA